MSMAIIAGKTAFLPMDPYEVEQFLYDLGLDGPGAEHHFEFVGGFYDDYLIDWGTDFRAANRLVQRISDMGDQREGFKSWCHTQEHCTVEEALRTSFNTRSFTFFPDMDTDEALGEFALENNFFEDYNALPPDIYDALDKTKAGARMREAEGGVFVDDGYLVVFEDFSGEPLPAEEPVAYFQIRFSDEHHDSGWCDVPLSADDDSRIAAMLEQDRGLEMECRSIIPQLNGIVSKAGELPELCRLNEALAGMDSRDLQKFKALSEAFRIRNVSAAFRLADEMGLYNVTLEYADPADYGLQHAARQYGLDTDCPLLDYMDLAGYGAEMLRAEGYEATRYGAVHRNAMAQKFLAGPNTVYSEDSYLHHTTDFSTYVCWDPDVQKVWLELSDVTADEETYYEDLARYQYNCEDWGVHYCASKEEYERIVSEFAAQSYYGVMAEEQNQDFGGMEGMS